MLCALKKNGSAADTDRCFKREKGLADLDLFTIKINWNGGCILLMYLLVMGCDPTLREIKHERDFMFHHSCEL